MMSPGLSSSSPASNGVNKTAVVFEDLWTQLRECHQSALQEFESKVSKLKKERCLDAQRLQEFYNRHQQLKEKHKSLQDTVSLLEERLQTSQCDRCAVSEEHMRKRQAEYEKDLQQNLRLITELKNEKNGLQDENRKLSAELDKLKKSCPEPRQTSSLEQEEGVIPDSPQSSCPMVNKLKRRKRDGQGKHVRYAETPLPQPHSLLLSGNQGKADILVPNTCVMDTSQTLPEDVKLNLGEVVAETCRLDLPDGPPRNTLTSADPQRNSPPPKKSKTALRPASRPYGSSSSSSSHSSFSSSSVHCPDLTTERSPSLLPSGKLVGGGSSLHQSKQMKEERSENAEEDTFIQQGRRASQHPQGGVEEKRKCQQALFKHPSTPLKSKESLSHEAKAKRRPLQDLNASITIPCPHAGKGRVETMWSVDPAAALSQYDTDTPTAVEEEHHSLEKPADTDSTFISHSLLQDGDRSVSGQMQKASDSLDKMFDTTAYGEYKSQYITHLGQTQPCDDDDDDDDEEEEVEEDEEGPPPETTGAVSEEHKARNPTFAHVTVVRKKEERRKLKGTTCKECEVYYAHLPEEERLKKLSACSRHRFLFLPPCTPENFWEVGFPSTQTCVERGYIKEEKNPQPRLRRRLPYNSLFSPKHKKQDT